MTQTHHSRHRFHSALASGVVVALLVVLAVPAAAQNDAPLTPAPFGFSTFAAEGRQSPASATPISGAALLPSATISTASVAVGSNVNIIGSSDVTQQATIDNTAVKTCDPGKQTAQNETSIAVDRGNASSLVAGANDYRLYEPTEDRYDGSGGFYVSANGGASWSVGLLPGLVRANSTAPGSYESAGDPSVAAGPAGTFWYANLAFDRSDNANSVQASVSTNSGATWTTHPVFATSAADGAKLFNDKEWVGADPSSASTAYVTWTQFHMTATGHTLSSIIVISKTTDGGAHWSAPVPVSPFRYNQGSVVLVDASGDVHVTYEGYYRGHDVAAYSVSTDGGATFTTKLLGRINDIPSPLPGATFRDNSFPAFALEGSDLHVVWSNWNGSNADVVYARSTDGGATWSTPSTIAGGAGDQFFPWVSANGARVAVSFFDRPSANDTYGATIVASNDGGASWTAGSTLTTASSTVSDGNAFGYPSCAYSFIGDYSGIALGSDGVAHPMWTDIRIGNDGSGADQDPYTASAAIQ